MAFKATKYFVLTLLLVIAGTRYMNTHRQRINLNNEVGAWDTKQKDGLRYTVITRSNETGGAYCVVHTYCTTKAQGFYPNKPGSPPMHIHTSQVEEFETLSGVLMLDINGTEVELRKGTAMAVPPGMPHTFYNLGPEPVEFLVRLTPGVPDEGFLETVVGLSQQFGGLSRVNPLQLFLLFVESNITLVDIPPPLWQAASKVVVPLARIMGFSSRYPDYTTKAGQPLPVISKEDPRAALEQPPAPAPVPETVPAPAPEAPAAEAPESGAASEAATGVVAEAVATGGEAEAPGGVVAEEQVEAEVEAVQAAVDPDTAAEL